MGTAAHNPFSSLKLFLYYNALRRDLELPDAFGVIASSKLQDKECFVDGAFDLDIAQKDVRVYVLSRVRILVSLSRFSALMML